VEDRTTTHYIVNIEGSEIFVIENKRFARRKYRQEVTSSAMRKSLSSAANRITFSIHFLL
jgi:3-phosphoglycerate kinase